jgi:hypothetical protein
MRLTWNTIAILVVALLVTFIVAVLVGPLTRAHADEWHPNPELRNHAGEWYPNPQQRQTIKHRAMLHYSLGAREAICDRGTAS